MRQISLIAAIVLLAGSAGLCAQATHASKSVSGDAAAGDTVFQHRCVMCHSLTPDVKIVGPSLYSEMRGPHAHTVASVREVIVNGKGPMPPMGKQLSDEEIADLLAYLRKQ